MIEINSFIKKFIGIGIGISILFFIIFIIDDHKSTVTQILIHPTDSNEIEITFDGHRAYRNAEYQVNLGPRIPGSEAHSKTIQWISGNLMRNGWQVNLQEELVGDTIIRNVIAKSGSGQPWILLGAHYDTRLLADRDPIIDKQADPVLGANDGASGVAILVELSRILPGIVQRNGLEGEIWLVFFDAEDNGNIGVNKFAMGSEVMVDNLIELPDAVVILDMVGDKELEIFKEENSHPDLIDEVWETAKSLGYGNHFNEDYKHRILDDHIPFRNAGARAIDVIDFDYPYWHTTSDTLDKISENSLRVVGETIAAWVRRTLDRK